MLPEDLLDLAGDVLRHRISLTYEALADGITADMLVERIVKAMPAPAKPLAHVEAQPQDRSQDERAAANG